MKEQKKKQLFTNRQLAALLIPLALDQLLNSFMGTVDTLIVSNIGSDGYFGGIPGGRNQYPGCGSVSGLGGWRYGRLFSVSWKQRRGEGK